MARPAKTLRILLLEDQPTDAELEIEALRGAGLAFTSLRVDTRDGFLQALEEFHPDIILADYRLPAFNGREALEILKRNHHDVPVVVVSGTLGDEGAVELLKVGARDYVLKDRLVNLAPAVLRTLSEEEGIRSRKFAEEKYRALFDEALDGIVLFDCETGAMIDCNPELVRLTGRSLEEITQLKIWELLPQRMQEAGRMTFLDIREKGSGESDRFEFEQQGGRHVSIDFTAKVMHIGENCFIQAIIRDITERKRAEEALRQSEGKFRSLVESTNDWIWEVNEQGAYTYVSPQVKNILGYAPEEVLGRPLFDLMSAEESLRLGETFGKILENPQLLARLENTNLHKNGKPVVLETSGVPIMDDAGNFRGYRGIDRDITERKESEKALARANRALRTLSAGNEALVRAKSEPALLESACRVIVEKGGYHVVWILYGETEGDMRPVASFGKGGYFSETRMMERLEKLAKGASRDTLRKRVTTVSDDILSDPRFAPWLAEVKECGCRSTLAIPLFRNASVFGALIIAATEAAAFDPEEIALLEELAEDLSYGIATLRTRKERDLGLERERTQSFKLSQALEETIGAIAMTLEKRDPYTAGHQQKVAEIASAIAKELALSEERVNGIHFGALIHDIGKIYVPSEILNRPGKLTEIEFALIRSHPDVGFDIVKDIHFPWPVAQMVRQHHERLDGSGYPLGLKHGEISREARILSVADVLEAMSSHRPYRASLGMDAAIAEIEKGKGRLFDPEVVEGCLRAIKKGGISFLTMGVPPR